MSQLIVELRRSANILDQKPSEVYGLNKTCRDAADEIERLRADYKRLRDAAHEIYWSANWTADRDVDHDAMWDELRDAGVLEQKARDGT